ncbi:Protein of unknown function [Micromonospora pattaloongensis]|uniref:DUF998 domain-containing protein n=1 Tax=Micromonospora pattaloongensis TaxID=405436 RepID=A0A1H3KMT1_9ACTN|nr:DUF998 domain-containing protein [Micromonospora pattaloongensis]SDY53346.1 Protein of unknown function [Micromonospora pattaloongensis]
MDVADRARRIGAACGGAAIVAGTAAVIVALAAGPAPGLAGYVSEAGVAGHPQASTYRLGIGSLVAGLLLLAAAVPTSRAVAALLAAAAAGIAVSGAVPCTAGCPLPPASRSTPADLAHAAVSIAAVAALVLAPVLAAHAPAAAPGWRRWSARTALVALPLSAAYPPAFLLVGRGLLLGLLERLLLLVVAWWLLATAAIAARRPGGTEHSRSSL